MQARLSAPAAALSKPQSSAARLWPARGKSRHWLGPMDPAGVTEQTFLKGGARYSGLCASDQMRECRCKTLSECMSVVARMNPFVRDMHNGGAAQSTGIVRLSRAVPFNPYRLHATFEKWLARKTAQAHRWSRAGAASLLAHLSGKFQARSVPQDGRQPPAI